MNIFRSRKVSPSVGNSSFLSQGQGELEPLNPKNNIETQGKQDKRRSSLFQRIFLPKAEKGETTPDQQQFQQARSRRRSSIMSNFISVLSNDDDLQDDGSSLASGESNNISSFVAPKHGNNNNVVSDNNKSTTEEAKALGFGRRGKRKLPDYIDPPMPTIGKPIKFNQLESRNRLVSSAVENLMVLVTRDVSEAIARAGDLPVEKVIERVVVTEPIIERMGQRKNKYSQNMFVKGNVNEIQKVLTYRKTVIEMMNANYSKKLIRDIEPIAISEARRLTILK